MTSSSRRSQRPGIHPRWDQYLVSRSTPATFFCAVFYIAICSILTMLYFTQYQTQPLHIAGAQHDGGAIFRDLKALPQRLPVVTEAAVAFQEKQQDFITPVKSEVGVNTTEPPITTPGVVQPVVEPKNWAGGGYQSIPGNKPLVKHCGTCAVVTSSGHLKGSKEGANIDNADCVIRMNAAPSLQYEEDVGSRTTFRVIGHRNFPSMIKKEEQQKYHITNETTKSDYLVITWLYGVNVEKNTPHKLCRILAKKYKNFVCYLGTEDTMNRNLNVFYNELGISRDTSKLKLWLSTGWTTLLFALEACDKIDAYGMVYDGYCDENPKDKTLYHYYDRVRSECSYYARSERKTTGGHKFLTEKAIFAKWASIYNITFHRPSWEGHLAERQNLSSSIDSPYKRIYHYLQWKKEHEGSTNVSKDLLSKPSAPKPANFSIHNKFTAKSSKAADIEPPPAAAVAVVADDNTPSASAGSNETMRSDSIVAYEVEGAGLVLVDRRTGKSAKGWTITPNSVKKTTNTRVKNRPAPVIQQKPKQNSDDNSTNEDVKANLHDNGGR